MKRIIVDTNVMGLVFSNDKSSEYFPVYSHCLETRKCLIIYGGTKYDLELSKSKAMVILFDRLTKTQIAKRLSTGAVDLEEQNIKEKLKKRNDVKCDDEHLIAIASVGNVEVICSDDKRAHPYLQDKSLYKKEMKPPKIYSSSKHTHLLV